MSTLQESIEIISLFDIYQNLLTEKQRQYIIDYYYNDYSLSEMSENYKVSRNAILDLIKRTTKKLYEYEEKLELLSREKNITLLIETLKKKSKDKDILDIIDRLEKVE